VPQKERNKWTRIFVINMKSYILKNGTVGVLDADSCIPHQQFASTPVAPLLTTAPKSQFLRFCKTAIPPLPSSPFSVRH
jgi:hypothetical protein